MRLSLKIAGAIAAAFLLGQNLAADFDLTKPIPEVRLKNGTVLKDVQIKSYGTVAAMVRHADGAGTIRYDLFPDDLVEALAPLRPAIPTLPAIPADSAPVAPVENGPDFATMLTDPLPPEISAVTWDRSAQARHFLRGLFEGTAEPTSITVADFVAALRSNGRLNTLYNKITLTDLKRDPATGKLAFEIAMSVRPQQDLLGKSRTEWETFVGLSRDEQVRVALADQPPLPPAPGLAAKWSERALLKNRLSGQVFLATAADTAYKFANATVRIYPRSYALALAAWLKQPGQPHLACAAYAAAHRQSFTGGETELVARLVASLRAGAWGKAAPTAEESVTDADGRFEIASRYSECGILVYAQRPTADRTEHYVWLLTDNAVFDRDKIMFSNTNVTETWESRD